MDTRSEKDTAEDYYQSPASSPSMKRQELNYSGADDEDEENLNSDSFHNLQYLQMVEQIEQQQYQHEQDLQSVQDLTTELMTLCMNICADQSNIVANNSAFF
jgi:hypothetical protein